MTPIRERGSESWRERRRLSRIRFRQSSQDSPSAIELGAIDRSCAESRCLKVVSERPVKFAVLEPTISLRQRSLGSARCERQKDLGNPDRRIACGANRSRRIAARQRAIDRGANSVSLRRIGGGEALQSPRDVAIDGHESAEALVGQASGSIGRERSGRFDLDQAGGRDQQLRDEQFDRFVRSPLREQPLGSPDRNEIGHLQSHLGERLGAVVLLSSNLSDRQQDRYPNEQHRPREPELAGRGRSHQGLSGNRTAPLQRLTLRDATDAGR